MKNIFNRVDYTSTARDIAFRYPVVNAIGTQVNFWIIAFFVLALILYFFSHSLNVPTPIADDPMPFFASSFVMSVLFGVATGISEHFIFNRKLSRASVGLVIVAKGLFYTLLMTVLFSLLRYVFWDFLIENRYQGHAEFLMSRQTTIYSYVTMLTWTLAMGLVISFVVQINSKYGPGVLVPILLGKYLEPIEEERIFIFLDLKSSTAIAERIGHIKYSQLIRECFIDINEVSRRYRAEIYQYVGDEIVLTWKTKSLQRKIDIVDFYYSTKFALEAKQEYYLKTYGVLPEFKAGAHVGKVTAVEVGSIKREVAYHGDTINVTSRIQGKCSEFGSDLLISKELSDTIQWDDRYQGHPIVSVYLQGRTERVTLIDVKWYLNQS